MIYLLCTDKPRHKANGTPVRHYLGFVGTGARLKERVHEHNSGKGSRLTNAVHADGGTWYLVALWPDGTYDDERRMHVTAKFNEVCPKCLAERSNRAWIPGTAEIRDLPRRRKRLSQKLLTLAPGKMYSSTPVRESGPSLPADTPTCDTRLTEVTPTAQTRLGGYVFGASVRQTSTASPFATTKQRSTSGS